MAPTILELAGIEISENIHGKSILPLLRNEPVKWRDAFVYEGLGKYGGTKPNLTVINQKFKYILTYEDETLEDANFIELYDMKNDPDEMTNLASDNSYLSVIRKLKAEIENHRKNILHLNN
jgi:arylsulfatase A-like enzyme